MKLINIKLNAFAGVINKSYIFNEGLNVIKGPNEGGKSTLIKAIQSALLVKTDLTENNLHLIDLIGDPAAWGKGRNKTVEYYLYSAWLTKNNLIDDTVMWGQFTHRTFKTGPTTYDLRRATE